MLLYDTDDGTIDSDSPFVGEHADEFAPAITAGGNGHVLILGAGAGSGARSIVAVEPRRQIWAVDLRSDRARLARSIFRRVAPDARIEWRVDDAFALSEAPENVAAVWVDLYVGRDLHPGVFEAEFYADLVSRISPAATFFVNAFGLPWHLGPLLGDTAQARVARAMIDAGMSVDAIPYRRNLSLVGQCGSERGLGWHQSPGPAEPAGSKLASLVRRVNTMRRLVAYPVVQSRCEHRSDGTFERGARLMESRFADWVEQTSSFLELSKYRPTAVSDLCAVGDVLLAESAYDAAAAVPAYFGTSLGEVWTRRDIDEFGRWVENLCRDAGRGGGEPALVQWLILHAVPQAIAGLVHHSSARSEEEIAARLAPLCGPLLHRLAQQAPGVLP